jgi:acetyl-CoA carboxylase biotin carboxyl carrier protein
VRPAVSNETLLAAPGPGTWYPAVALGAPLVPGAVLGELERAGRRLTVTAPGSAGGVAVHVVEAGTWVAFGEVLVEMGEGSGAVATRAPGPARPADVPDDVTVVAAETEGTIYLRPKPEAPAFAPEGATLAALDTVALVEVMKTFTPVRTPVAGKVVRVCVDDGQAVGPGAALLWVRAAD